MSESTNLLPWESQHVAAVSDQREFLMGTINRRTNLAKITASLTIVLLVALSFRGNADKIGQKYTEAGFKRALITFASARAINGLISVAQGTEMAIQPGAASARF
jgi:hypothetical protein